MRKIIGIVILLFTLLLVVGCEKNEAVKVEDEEYYLYFINNSETKLVKEVYKPKSTNTEELINELLEALHKGSKDVTNKKTIPDNVNLPNCVYPKSDQLQLQFDGTYRELTGISELMRRAAIVKTLCQVKEITDVEFYVEGVTLMDTDGKPVGVMTASSFIESSNYQQQQSIILYFVAENKKILQSLDAIASYDGSTPIESIVINQLIEGPDNIEGLDMKLYGAIPEGTKCNSITTVDYICYVDLSKEFLNRKDSVKDELVVYSIVNSLVALPSINKVKITIDGESVKTYGTVTNFNQFLEKNFTVVTDSE